MRRALLALPLLAGCAATDPLENKEAWRPAGVNEANIAAELANPLDAVHGRTSAVASDGQTAASAVQRLRADQVKALPDSALSDIKVQSSPSAGTASGGS